MVIAWIIFANMMFGGTGVFTVIAVTLYIIGLWAMLKKSDIPGWWAVVPWAREYWLGMAAGKEPEGRVTAVCSLLAFVGKAVDPLLGFYVFGSHPSLERLLTMTAVVQVMLSIIYIVYKIQIYNALTEVYDVRKRWIFLWVFADFIPALVWGYSKKYQPSWKFKDFRESAVAHVRGGEVAEIGEGLTVNLEDRSVTEFFKKKTLLRDIHLNIKPGRLVMLLGGSGAGKTTFLNAVNGYEKANAKVILNGRNVYAEYKKMQYEVGFVPQQDLMRGKDTVLHTLRDTAIMRLPSEFKEKDRKERVDEAMAIFGLEPVKNNLVEKLSGGQRKRLSIAMEFLSNPYLFILDEPDSGLDGVMARELFVQLRKIADTGRIVIVITHTPDRVIDLFDDVIILAKDSTHTGRLAWYGPVDECREFFGKERMEEIVKSINRPEEGGEGRADEFIIKYAEVQHV